MPAREGPMCPIADREREVSNIRTYSTVSKHLLGLGFAGSTASYHRYR